MDEWSREQAVDRVEQLLATIEAEPMPVPIREVWVFGDLALGLDPVDRLDIYLTKEILLTDDDGGEEFQETHGIEGVGQTVRTEWAREFPEYLRANPNGYAAPERCLAAHLLDGEEPIHLEVCNTGFENNVTQRLAGAQARDNFEELLDPRGVCLYLDGQRSPDAFEKLRNGEYVFPPLSGAFEMLSLDSDEAERAAEAVQRFREQQDGVSVRGDVV